jgi:hypothetical protein
MSSHAQYPPGVIINGVAVEDIPKAIERIMDSEGFERPVLKALIVPDTYPGIDAFPSTGGVMGGGTPMPGLTLGEGTGLTNGIPDYIDMDNPIRITGVAPASWCTLGQPGKDEQFLGVTNPDTRPYTNVGLTNGIPKDNLDNYDYDVRANRQIGIIRGCIVPVQADGDVGQQKFLELGADGKFKEQGTQDRTKAVGVAYQSATDEDIFEAFVYHRR